MLQPSKDAATNCSRSWIRQKLTEHPKYLRSLTRYERGLLSLKWECHARPSQLPPEGDWNGWLIIAGRGWGKTRVGAEYIRAAAESGRVKRIGLVGETSADGRNVMVEGESGILAVSNPRSTPLYESSKGLLTWPNGTIATLYDGCKPDQLRGPEHDLIWFDELAKYSHADDVFNMAMFGLRMGAHPRWIATTTPRPIPLIKQLVADTRRVVVTRGGSEENAGNLAPIFREAVIERYRGTRLGRQELDAEILEDMPGALWTRSTIDATRVAAAPELTRIVVGVDPAASSGERANETGIVVMGLARNGQAYVLQDCSLHGSPDTWARRAVGAYRQWAADCLVAEANQGGEMVAHVIQSIADIPVKLVRATRNKHVRAEPFSALYEQGRVHHVGVFRELEDQMVAFSPDASVDGSSPDRVDALVWAAAELFPDIILPPQVRIPPPVYQPGDWMRG
ncbi:MAG TPA: terminase family protein [Micropepsaceae bacterium]|nr:terminase family protein [Micropepsaceae bacterium]